MNYEEKSDWTLGKNEPKTNPNKANRRPLAGNPKLEILNPKQIRMNEIQRYKTRFFAEFILEQSKGLEMTTKWISAHRETILCKTKPIQSQFEPNQSQLVKTGTRPKTQDTRPKIQILSLKSGKAGQILQMSRSTLPGVVGRESGALTSLRWPAPLEIVFFQGRIDLLNLGSAVRRPADRRAGCL